MYILCLYTFNDENVPVRNIDSRRSVFVTKINSFDFVVASWMYLYASIPIPTCQQDTANKPKFVHRKGCYLTSTDAWIKLIITRPGVRSLAMTFEGQNITCSLADGANVLVRCYDGNHRMCTALWDSQATEKPTCTYRCSCVEGVRNDIFGFRALQDPTIHNICP